MVMKKIFLLSLVLITVLACSISFPNDSFDDKTATRVAIVLTATALDQEIKQQVTESIPTEKQGEPSTTATNTPVPPDDPKQELGQPTWKDDLSTGQYWSLDAGDIEIDTTTFSLSNGKLSANAAVIGKGNNWWLTYLTFQDAYLEATFDVAECATDDQYGLVIRAPDYESGFAYYFHITCDGHYDLRRWSSNGSLEEVNDSALINNGHFGLFINARQTPGFTINMDEISYWTLN
jgi:hypothetical protein